jgi:hypothetical protein
MRKPRKNDTPVAKVASLRRHLIDEYSVYNYILECIVYP